MFVKSPPIHEVTKFNSLLIYTLVLVLSFPLTGGTDQKQDSYLIGREDIVDITVWQAPDLTKSVVVGSDGTIDYPLLGNIPAMGLTTGQLQKQIEEKLAKGYVKNPQVGVSVKEYNSKKILVFGEVSKPGLYKLKGKIPLLELLFMVGGVSTSAKRLTIIRQSQVSADAIPAGLLPRGEPNQKEGAEASSAIEVDLIALLSKGSLSQNVMIQPGDTLYFASGTGQRYYVLGQVGTPGPYEWVQDITLLEAIKLAGGVNERGAANRIKVRKTIGGQKQEIKVNITDIMRGKKKDDVIIKSGDTIIVPESWI